MALPLILLPQQVVTHQAKAAALDTRAEKVIETSLSVSTPSFPDMSANYQATIVVPAAQAAAQAAEEAAAQQAQVNVVATEVKPNGTYANDYAFGNCTAYVASRVAIPSSLGNADNWASELGASGWTVSGTPVVGAIAQTTAGPMGHVAIVEAVNGDGTVTVSEMNYDGFDMVDTRVAPVGEFTYIYQ